MNAQTRDDICRAGSLSIVDSCSLYLFQQGQNNVGLNNSEVAQYITLHRYEWKQEVHTDL